MCQQQGRHWLESGEACGYAQLIRGGLPSHATNNRRRYSKSVRKADNRVEPAFITWTVGDGLSYWLTVGILDA